MSRKPGDLLYNPDRLRFAESRRRPQRTSTCPPTPAYLFGELLEDHTGDCAYCQWNIGLTYRQHCPDVLAVAQFRGIARYAGAFEFHLESDGCERCSLLLESRAIAFLADFIHVKDAALKAAEAARDGVAEARQAFQEALNKAGEFAQQVITFSIPLPLIGSGLVEQSVSKGVPDETVPAVASEVLGGGKAEARVEHVGAQMDFLIRTPDSEALPEGELVIPNLRIPRSFTFRPSGDVHVRLHTDELEDVDSQSALVLITPGLKSLK